MYHKISNYRHPRLEEIISTLKGTRRRLPVDFFLPNSLKGTYQRLPIDFFSKFAPYFAQRLVLVNLPSQGRPLFTTYLIMSHKIEQPLNANVNNPNTLVPPAEEGPRR